MGNLFSMEGRIGRQQYILISLVITVVMYGVSFTAGFMMGMGGAGENATVFVGFLIGLVAAIIQSFLIVKRLHDLDRPGSHYWLFFIPLYNIYLGLILLFTKGTEGNNQYGIDPTTA